jgi:excisionase family DNA binding protein
MSNTEELTKTEAAAALGLSTQTLDRRIRSGLIPAYRKAGSRRVVLLSPDIKRACAAVPLVPVGSPQRAGTALTGGEQRRQSPGRQQAAK